MYEIIPQRTNKAATYTSAVMLITAFAAMFFSGISWLPYRSIMQLASLVILAFAILILIRYVLTRYIYCVIPTDGGDFDLTVTEAKRKSRITVCRISLSGIERVTVINSEKKKTLPEMTKGYKVFNYCVDIAPERYCCVFAEECGEKLVLKLSYDEQLFAILSKGTDE